jgi:hypothetical protein
MARVAPTPLTPTPFQGHVTPVRNVRTIAVVMIPRVGQGKNHGWPNGSK